MRGLLSAPVVALALALLLAPGAARAQVIECPDEAPSDAEVTRRLAWIERSIDGDEDDVRRWFTGFAIAHALLGAVNATLAFSSNSGANMDSEVWWRGPGAPFAVNATGSFLGLITILASTPPILGAGDFVRSLDRSTPEARLASLRAAEARLMRDHDAASFVRGDLASMASTLYVAAASSTLVLLGHTVPGMLHAVGGTILAQGRLLLHPTGPISAWRTYRAHHPEAGCTPGVAAPLPAPSVAVSPSSPAGGGLGVSLSVVF
jgi:hypothetical protein